MRVLLDENLPHKLRALFPDSIEVITVDYRGWKGKENGELLQMAAFSSSSGQPTLYLQIFGVNAFSFA